MRSESNLSGAGHSASSDSQLSGGHRSNQDAGHYEYKNGTILKKYKIDGFLGDGTFGRCLSCTD